MGIKQKKTGGDEAVQMQAADGTAGKKKKNGRLTAAIRESPINYFSDLLICAMVVLWILDNVYESVIASAVTISSMWISVQTSTNCYETSMWSSIGSNIALPLSCGGAIWMIKNGVQHAIANQKGKQAHMDFPAVNADGQDDGVEEMIGGEENEEASDNAEAG